MGIPVLVLGKSGSGKSTSLRNFEQGEVGIFNVASKPLPFKKKLDKIDGATYENILKSLSNKKMRTYVIDDSQYLMAFEMFSKVNETGYKKFTDMAVNFYNLVKYIIEQLPNDIIVYFMHHIQENEYGIKAKTVGKMLDDQLTVEGLFSIVLLAQSSMGCYKFITHTGGSDTVKTPLGMFESTEIDNDLKAVDMVIREYYELTEGKKNEKTV